MRLSFGSILGLGVVQACFAHGPVVLAPQVPVKPEGLYWALLEVPSTKYLRPLVPQTRPVMVVGTRVLEYWVLGPFGSIGTILGLDVVPG